MIDLPAGLAMRPMEIKRKLPVPWSNEFERADGSFLVNFAAVNHERALASAQGKLCGLCGQPLSYWIAFLGGPRAAKARTYGDPPMHEACAQAAVSLCPHIAIQRHKRVPEERLNKSEVETSVPVGWVDTKPDQWVMGLTRQFEWKLSQGSLIFHAAPFKHIRTFSYDSEGKIQESK